MTLWFSHSVPLWHSFVILLSIVVFVFVANSQEDPLPELENQGTLTLEDFTFLAVQRTFFDPCNMSCEIFKTSTGG